MIVFFCKLIHRNVSIISSSQMKPSLLTIHFLYFVQYVNFLLITRISWQRESGVDVANSSSRTVWLSKGNESFARSVIEFFPVTVMDSGKYTCTVSFKVSDVLQSIRVQASYQLRLQGPLYNEYLLLIFLFINNSTKTICQH